MRADKYSSLPQMKIKFLEAVVFEERWRCGVVLSALLFLISVGITPGSAQLKKQKRVTSLQLTGASEGSRVTIVSDSTLSDYEAFRRGDRFYVKIPLAYFSSSLPRFHGDGFEDVQVQKMGGSVIVSFKLQPGATARVDQRSNRLDVTFSTPNRARRGVAANAGSNRATSAATAGIGPSDNRQSSQARERVIAGPIPFATPPSYRERVVLEGTTERQGRQVGRVQTKPANPSNKSAKNGAVTNRSANEKIAAKPTTNPPSSTSKGYPAVTAAKPSPNTAPSPNVTSSESVESPIGSQPEATSNWFSARRLITLLVPLVLLGLILFFVSSPKRRLTNAGKSKRVKAKVEPKYPKQVPVNDGVAGLPVDLQTATPELNKTSKEPAPSLKQSDRLPAGTQASADAARTSETREMAHSSTLLTEPTLASSVGVGAQKNKVWVLTEPTIGSVAPRANQSSIEEEEREVFEL